MLPKQREMDGVVKTIFEALGTKSHLESTLLVICGDHGMNDAGNHGASSPGETSPAVVFMSPKMRTISSGLSAPTQPKDEFDYYEMVEQSDLAPTIAALLGFPVSMNNLGAFVPAFLNFWPHPKDKIQILIRNARQILQIIVATFGWDLYDEFFNMESKIDPCKLEQTQIHKLACEWHTLNRQASELASKDEFDDVWLSAMTRWLRKAQDLISSMASNYNVSRLALGQGLSIVGLSASAVAAYFALGSHETWPAAQLSAIAILYGIMMFASSYVEEEQHFWYWSSTLWLTYLGINNVQR
jgi:ethanolamine phosphate transferase 2 subunit G